MWQADQLIRQDISWKKWRIRNKIALRSGFNFLLPDIRCEPSEPMVRKIYNEILEAAKSVNIVSLDGPTGEAGYAAPCPAPPRGAAPRRAAPRPAHLNLDMHACAGIGTRARS